MNILEFWEENSGGNEGDTLEKIASKMLQETEQPLAQTNNWDLFRLHVVNSYKIIKANEYYLFTKSPNTEDLKEVILK